MSVLVVALDVPNEVAAQAVVVSLPLGRVWYKVGLELFTAAGPEFVRGLTQTGQPVFLDLKFHDIPNTVRGACRSAAGLGVQLLSIHLAGGEAMAKAAVQGAAEGAAKGQRPKVLGITVLTSAKAGNAEETQRVVVEQASLAKAYGLDGVVCSGLEAAAVKHMCGPGMLCLCPGIRFEGGASHHDQKRVCTPAFATAAGADFLVMGRPLLEAANPHEATLQALAQMREAAM